MCPSAKKQSCKNVQMCPSARKRKNMKMDKELRENEMIRQTKDGDVEIIEPVDGFIGDEHEILDGRKIIRRLKSRKFNGKSDWWEDPNGLEVIPLVKHKGVTFWAYTVPNTVAE